MKEEPQKATKPKISPHGALTPKRPNRPSHFFTGGPEASNGMSSHTKGLGFDSLCFWSVLGVGLDDGAWWIGKLAVGNTCECTIYIEWGAAV